jgi:hypothetical protein
MQRCGRRSDRGFEPFAGCDRISIQRRQARLQHEDEDFIRKRRILVKSIMKIPANLVSNSLSFVV